MTTPEPSPVAARPSPELAPTEVVLAQLAALQREPYDGAGAGAGLRGAWEFASPGNRAATGPVEQFADMVRGPVYGGLLGHRAVQLGPLVQAGDDAQQEVLLVTALDETIGFTWVLSLQQDPPHTDCWMTDGVLRHPDRSGTP